MSRTLALLLLSYGSVFAAEPVFVQGRPAGSDLAPDERAVRSMIVSAGKVFAGTSGTAAHLLAVEGDRVRSLVRLDGGIALYGLCATADGKSLFAGTAAAPQIPERYVHRPKTGRLLRFDLSAPAGAAPATVTDLGEAVAGHGVVALTFDEGRAALYGLTEAGHFFVFDLKTGKSRDLGKVAGHRPYETELPPQVSRALAVLADGTVVTAGAEGRLVKYDPTAAKLVAPAPPVRGKPAAAWPTLPAVAGRQGWASLEAIVRHPSGRWFGGTSDGYLFSMDAGATEILNHGKPTRQGGMHGLAVGPDGRVYGVTGEPAGMPRGFAFDPGRGAFALEGIPATIPAPGEVSQSMEGFGAIVVDGSSLICGERDRLGRVLRFALPK